MSIEVANGTDVLGPIASNLGYSELVSAGQEWPALKSLFQHGVSENVEAVVNALRELAEAEDTDPSVAETANGIVDLIEGADMIIITDGTEEDNAA